ncbi:MAG: hypothetical protein AAF950_17200 [Pseudomonadota bacterium]
MVVNKALKKEFLDLVESGLPGVQAAKQVGVSVRTMERAREKDEQFGKDWHDARLEGARKRQSELETEAWRRAVKGTKKPVYQGGKKVGAITEYSNTLLMFLIKAEARRAGDDSFVERSDVTSRGDKVEAGVIVVGRRHTDEDEWHAEHSKS